MAPPSSIRVGDERYWQKMRDERDEQDAARREAAKQERLSSLEGRQFFTSDRTSSRTSNPQSPNWEDALSRRSSATDERPVFELPTAEGDRFSSQEDVQDSGVSGLSLATVQHVPRNRQDHSRTRASAEPTTEEANELTTALRNVNTRLDDVKQQLRSKHNEFTAAEARCEELRIALSHSQDNFARRNEEYQEVFDAVIKLREEEVRLRRELQEYKELEIDLRSQLRNAERRATEAQAQAEAALVRADAQLQRNVPDDSTVRELQDIRRLIAAQAAPAQQPAPKPRTTTRIIRRTHTVETPGIFPSLFGRTDSNGHHSKSKGSHKKGRASQELVATSTKSKQPPRLLAG